MWATTTFPPLVECLKSLPNLHTLSIGGCATDSSAAPLAAALKGVKLPQIKILALSHFVYPLLQHCHDVEEVACPARNITKLSSDGFLSSLMSNRNSKLKRLVISLALLPNPSRKYSSTPWDREMIMMTDCF